MKHEANRRELPAAEALQITTKQAHIARLVAFKSPKTNTGKM
jgi:hypothetical protein